MSTPANAEHSDPTKGPDQAQAPVRLALVSTGAVGLLAALGAGFFGLRPAYSALVGGALATANLWVFGVLGRAFLDPKGRARALWGLLGAVKFAALIASVGLLLRYRIVDPIALIVGYGALPIGITLSIFLAGRGQDGA